MPLAATLRSSGLRLDVEAANAHIGRWLAEVANTRRHATTGERPAVRLAAEQAALLPLPAQAPALAVPDNRRVLPLGSWRRPFETRSANQCERTDVRFRTYLCRWGDPDGRHGSGDSHPPLPARRIIDIKADLQGATSRYGRFQRGGDIRRN
ncbi:hypothetical protein LMG28727_07764 [Paraburkholderia kirstenboschensis]|nr:hypothetical protein LMG28727_07764 [Paraburkholderia kirstenboschensis]